MVKLNDVLGMSLQDLELLEKNIKITKEMILKDIETIGKGNLYKIAIASGIKDQGYNTVANEYISSYSGKVEIIINNKKYIAIGHRPDGDAYSIYKNGYIEFIPVKEDNI